MLSAHQGHRVILWAGVSACESFIHSNMNAMNPIQSNTVFLGEQDDSCLGTEKEGKRKNPSSALCVLC